MSAFLCSDQHTYVLALYHALQLATDKSAPSLSAIRDTAHALRRLNNYALACRYKDEPQDIADDAKSMRNAAEWIRNATAADIHGAARCFSYQCSEGDVDQRPEWTIIQAIEACAKLDAGGADTDVWSINDGDIIKPTPRKLTAAEKTEARASAVSALIASHPHLVPVSHCKGGSLIAAAKNIRTELKIAFPGVKFSVKSERFSGGDSIDVRWTDGPTNSQVDQIIDKYSAGSFNGMDDSYTYSNDAWIAAFGDAKYVHSRRDHSDKAIVSAIRTVRAKYAGNFEAHSVPEPTLEEFRAGKLWNVGLIFDGCGRFGADSVQSAINIELSRRTWAISSKAHRAPLV